MSGRDLPAVTAALTVNGGSDGTVTLASVVGFYVGQRGYIGSGAVASKPVQILAVDTNNLKLTLKLIPEPSQAFEQVISTVENQPSVQRLTAPNYGGSDLSAYLLADSAKIICDRQFVYGA